VARWHFWVLGWSCGYGRYWTSRGGVGEAGGGALGSSHNARTRGRSSTSTSHTLLPFAPRSQVSGCMSAVDVMRIYISEIPRFKRRPVRVGGATGQCWRPATHRLVGSVIGYITRMCPFRHCTRHMQQISGPTTPPSPLINALCS
jgi:hypothetical protein